MIEMTPIDYDKMLNSVDVYYFGWSDEQIKSLRNQYQTKFWGHVHDNAIRLRRLL